MRTEINCSVYIWDKNDVYTFDESKKYKYKLCSLTNIKVTRSQIKEARDEFFWLRNDLTLNEKIKLMRGFLE